MHSNAHNNNSTLVYDESSLWWQCNWRLDVAAANQPNQTSFTWQWQQHLSENVLWTMTNNDCRKAAPQLGDSSHRFYVCQITALFVFSTSSCRAGCKLYKWSLVSKWPNHEMGQQKRTAALCRAARLIGQQWDGTSYLTMAQDTFYISDWVEV